MSLPLKAVDRLFDRLVATYGNEWVRRWEGLDDAAIKTLWAHELAGFAGRLDAIAWALENLPPRSPNVIEFRNLCKQAPRPVQAQLPEPKADPARLAAELAKLADVKVAARAAVNTLDDKAWAKRLMARHDAGERLNPTSLRFAREALRMHLPGVEVAHA